MLNHIFRAASFEDAAFLLFMKSFAKKRGRDMSEKKKKQRNFTFAAIMLIMVFALCITLISCGGDDPIENVQSQVKTEKYAEGDTDSKAEESKETDSARAASDDEKAADKNVEKKDAEQKSGTQKATQKTEQSTQKETQKSTQAATQAKKVCYITIEGYCSKKEISLQGGDTAYSILTRSGATVAGSSSYIKGINGRFEFDEGPTSGWIYYVNGSRPTVGCGSCSINAGDSITWDYVTKF